MEKKDTLYEMGYDELAERLSPELEDAVIGIITDGCNYGIAYDETLIPDGKENLVHDDDYIVTLMQEDDALKQLDNAVVFGMDGVNEYKGAIVGITGNHLLYDYDSIAECKMEMNSKEVVVDGITIGPMTYEDAVEDIDYNIIRAMPYYPQGPRIIMNGYMFE